MNGIKKRYMVLKKGAVETDLARRLRSLYIAIVVLLFLNPN
ncbi:MAG: hypothetical protein ACI8XX_002282 [Polaribacter sp.]|jgi:hypothetical protein